MIQRSAARYILNDYGYTSSVSDMISALNWKTLEYRRRQATLVMFFKIRNDLVAVDLHHLIPTRNLNYLIPHSKTNYHLNSFSQGYQAMERSTNQYTIQPQPTDLCQSVEFPPALNPLLLFLTLAFL
ncbi:hypothetical protein DPMN_118701 [Dreissena polymorpha]|uniref:Uncharacterized protein n=1 Tax=Dreissena polymorpha TaxID=45954 RepID=A0A9D4GGX8_DREPO|nr:hypothetical protein DPMN_118701 [Dreissena polymorpha]